MSNDLLKQLEQLGAEAPALIAAASDERALEAARVALLGRKEGRLTAILRGLGSLTAEERPAVGAAANRVKDDIGALLDGRAAELGGGAAGEATEDLTLPGRASWRGTRHPVTLVIDEICEIFAGLGFTRVRGPEVENEWRNFVALNTPLDHPAADMQDTFYLPGGLLLRSHTSPVQVRTMMAHQPPIRVVAPGMFATP